jgi:hypothetical protein
VLDPVVEALFEEYLAILPIGNREVNLPIPTADQAKAMLPRMRERRCSAEAL